MQNYGIIYVLNFNSLPVNPDERLLHGVNPEDYALNTSRILAPDEWYTINESKAYFELDNGTAIKRDIRYNFLNELEHTETRIRIRNSKLQVT